MFIKGNDAVSFSWKTCVHFHTKSYRWHFFFFLFFFFFFFFFFFVSFWVVGVGVVVVVRHFGFGDSWHNYVHPSLTTAPLGLWPLVSVKCKDCEVPPCLIVAPGQCQMQGLWSATLFDCGPWSVSNARTVKCLLVWLWPLVSVKCKDCEVLPCLIVAPGQCQMQGLWSATLFDCGPWSVSNARTVKCLLVWLWPLVSVKCKDCEVPPCLIVAPGQCQMQGLWSASLFDCGPWSVSNARTVKCHLVWLWPLVSVKCKDCEVPPCLIVAPGQCQMQGLWSATLFDCGPWSVSNARTVKCHLVWLWPLVSVKCKDCEVPPCLIVAPGQCQMQGLWSATLSDCGPWSVSNARTVKCLLVWLWPLVSVKCKDCEVPPCLIVAPGQCQMQGLWSASLFDCGPWSVSNARTVKCLLVWLWPLVSVKCKDCEVPPCLIVAPGQCQMQGLWSATLFDCGPWSVSNARTVKCHLVWLWPQVNATRKDCKVPPCLIVAPVQCQTHGLWSDTPMLPESLRLAAAAEVMAKQHHRQPPNPGTGLQHGETDCLLFFFL